MFSLVRFFGRKISQFSDREQKHITKKLAEFYSQFALLTMVLTTTCTKTPPNQCLPMQSRLNDHNTINITNPDLRSCLRQVTIIQCRLTWQPGHQHQRP